jgi:trehalose 6-phosphate phosphatase
MVTREPLQDALRRAAQAVPLLVVADFDGTLSALVSDPGAARPVPGAIEAAHALAELPDTTMALLSGRARDDLRSLSGAQDGVLTIGSHGAEWEEGLTLTQEQTELLAATADALGPIVDGVPGVIVERKPASVTVHVRQVPGPRAQELLDEVVAGPGSAPGVFRKHGKAVVELGVLQLDKGSALQRLQQACSAEVVVFLGDDVTDEAAFEVLRPQDVGVKVGQGPTAARWRIDDPPAAARLLTELAEARGAAGRR